MNCDCVGDGKCDFLICGHGSVELVINVSGLTVIRSRIWGDSVEEVSASEGGLNVLEEVNLIGNIGDLDSVPPVGVLGEDGVA